MVRNFLDKIYKSDLALSAPQLYRTWASSYDDELTENKYVTPQRCAEMLKRYFPSTECRVLDLGCGTGLSGEALYKFGFRQIDGLDLSLEMLELAKEKSIYSRLIHDNLNTLSKLDQKYNAIIAAGVISPGHANPETIRVALSFLTCSGVLVFSLNDHALRNASFDEKVKFVLSDSMVEILDEEYGDHIIDINLKAKILAVRKRCDTAFTV